MKNTLFLLAFFCSAIANAQVSLGPEAGLNISNMINSTDIYNTKSGGRFGIVADCRLSDNFYVQPGLFYSVKGGSTTRTSSVGLDDLAGLTQFAGLGDISALLDNLGSFSSFLSVNTSSDISYTFNYLQLPVHILYKSGSEGGNRFIAGLTVSAAYAVDGRYVASTTTSFVGITLHSNENRAITDSDIKRMDAGAGVNLGYEHHTGMFIRAFYDLGLIDNLLGQSQAFGISVGYLIHDK